MYTSASKSVFLLLAKIPVVASVGLSISELFYTPKTIMNMSRREKPRSYYLFTLLNYIVLFNRKRAEN
jgi:hypothetical protein